MAGGLSPGMTLGASRIWRRPGRRNTRCFLLSLYSSPGKPPSTTTGPKIRSRHQLLNPQISHILFSGCSAARPAGSGHAGPSLSLRGACLGLLRDGMSKDLGVACAHLGHTLPEAPSGRLPDCTKVPIVPSPFTFLSLIPLCKQSSAF